MAFSKADKDEVHAMFAQGLDNITQMQELKFQMVHQKLDSIIAQTTKTNGTLIRHTDQINNLERSLPHTIEKCPQNERIEAMYEGMITRKGMTRMLVGAIATMATIVTIIVTILNYLEKH